MADLVIGCPVRRREWILPAWFAAVEGACAAAGLSPEFVFVVPRGDLSIRTIEAATENPVELIVTDEEPADDKRIWDAGRYTRMVYVRNLLLERVRQMSPAVFWSLDSDILASPDCLRLSLELLADYDAVGQRTFMMAAPHTGCTSRARLEGARLLDREDAPGWTGPVDCIMAAKLMAPEAYAVDYVWHALGEDIGWSQECTARELKLGWDGRGVALKHVMSREWLTKIDPRCGF